MMMILIVIQLAAAAALMAYFCWKASALMQAEREREVLRRATAAAMRTDAHLARLRSQRMRVRYRVAP